MKEQDYPPPTTVLSSLLGEFDPIYGLGSMTVSLYDTSWVACVTRCVNGRFQLLFPSALRFILRSQQDNGGWRCNDRQPSSKEDEILCTLAAIHALCKFREHPAQMKQIIDSNELEARIRRSTAYVSRMLESWNLRDCQRVGYEMLLPGLLDCLASYNLHFDFANKSGIFALRKEKVSRLPVERLYDAAPSTLLHSLEAFFADPSFDYSRVRHQKISGSMMGSPSATAAYLMRSSVWDHDAEDFLRLVMEVGSGKGHGGVPNAFPSTNFEVLWAFTTLASSGALPVQETSPECQRCMEIVTIATNNGKSLVGFAPGFEADLDDSARACIAMTLIGKGAPLDALVSQFSNGHGRPFFTYKGERDPSFTANCNALIAILSDPDRIPDMATYADTIASFICETWWNSDCTPGDKWNTSPYYSAMLAAQAMTLLLQRWNDGLLENLPKSFLQERVLLLLMQCLIRTVGGQNSDGSWGKQGPFEETAYAILTLTSLCKFPLARYLKAEIDDSIARGRTVLLAQPGPEPEPLWIEKTLYGSNILSNAYITAALHAAKSNTNFGAYMNDTHQLCIVNEVEMSKLCKMMDSIPGSDILPKWTNIASFLEGQVFLTQLQKYRASIFEREGFTEDKYISWIPFIWTRSSNSIAHSGCLSPSFLFEMMVVSLLNFQADEYLEAKVGGQLRHQLHVARQTIDNALDELRLEQTCTNKNNAGDGFTMEQHTELENGGSTSERAQIPAPKLSINPLVENAELTNGSSNKGNVNGTVDGGAVPKIRSNIRRYISHMLRHPRVMDCSARDYKQLCSSLRDFFHSHIDQVEDNMLLATSSSSQSNDQVAKTTILINPRMSFKHWVRTTSANHTSCPFSFAFAMCIRASGREDYFGSLTAKYVADDFCRSLATMCRLQNDIGSIARDRREGNVNGVNFPELHDVVKPGQCEHWTDQTFIRQKLVELSQFEKQRTEQALETLERYADEGEMAMVRVFYEVTNMFGQIYMVKDLASQRLK